MTTSTKNYTVIRSEGEKTVLRWSERGWRVVPCHHVKSDGACSCSDGAKCKSPGKHPRTAHGFHDATTDPETIKGWFKEFPNANWGIATGKDSNLLVVDIDIKNAGYAAWKTLTDQHEPIPDTFTVQTGSGGKHLYFQYPKDWEPRNTEKKIVKGKGIDTRAEGGFVVVPPSKTSTTYTVLVDTSPVVLPTWLDALLRDIAEGKKPNPTPPPEPGPEPDEPKPYNEWTWDADLAESLFGGGKYKVDLVRTSRKPVHNRLEEIKFYLSIIPPMEEHEEWLKILMAVHSEVGEDGWQVVDEWGSQASSYDEAGNRHQWDGIKDDKINNTNMEYLRARARDVEPEKVAEYLANLLPSAGLVRDRFDWFSSDYLDSPDEPISWLVRGILEDDVTAIVYGDGGVGKTSALIDLCYCVAMGEPWLENNVTQGSVIYIDEQNSKRKVKRRLNAIRKGHSNLEPIPFHGCSYAGFVFDKNHPADLGELERKIKEVSARLVVIDSLVNVRGENDMNADEMENVINGLRKLSSEYRCAILVIHHENKSEGYSGSHTLKTEPDVLLQVSRNQGDTNITFTPNKVRDGWDTPFGANAIIEKDEETGVVLSYRLEKSEPGKRVKDGARKTPNQIDQVKEFLRDNVGTEVSTQDIAKATEITPRRVLEHCKDLAVFGQVEDVTPPDAPKKEGKLWKWIEEGKE